MKLQAYLMTFLLLVGTCCAAQKMTPAVTVYGEFQPATIHLADGKLLKVGLANIFLKNSSLLYKSGIETKEANIRTIRSVDFKDRTYYRIDTVLAYRVDSVGKNALYCAQRIDFAAWKQMVVNNSLITSLDLGDMIGYTAADLSNEQDIHFPMVNIYYLRLDKQYVLAHERNLKRVLNKKQRRMMESVMSHKDFSWNDERSLIELLKVLQ